MQNKNIKRTKQSGFTLMEVTAAVFVMSVGIFAAFDLYFRCMEGTSAMIEERTALSIVRSEVAWLEGAPDLDAGTYPIRGTSTMMERLPEGTGVVELSPRNDLAPDLLEAKVSVTWQVRTGRMATREVTTLVYPKGGAHAAN